MVMERMFLVQRHVYVSRKSRISLTIVSKLPLDLDTNLTSDVKISTCVIFQEPLVNHIDYQSPILQYTNNCNYRCNSLLRGSVHNSSCAWIKEKDQTNSPSSSLRSISKDSNRKYHNWHLDQSKKLTFLRYFPNQSRNLQTIERHQPQHTRRFNCCHRRVELLHIAKVSTNQSSITTPKQN